MGDDEADQLHHRPSFMSLFVFFLFPADRFDLIVDAERKDDGVGEEQRVIDGRVRHDGKDEDAPAQDRKHNPERGTQHLWFGEEILVDENAAEEHDPEKESVLKNPVEIDWRLANDAIDEQAIDDGYEAVPDNHVQQLALRISHLRGWLSLYV